MDPSQSFLIVVMMPLALAVIMLGLGLTLTLADFARVATRPRAVLIAMACQMLLLPAACYALAKGLQLEGALAVGLMLLAASPGGVTANVLSHLAHGDVALNITLTAVNSVLSLFTLPLIVNFALTRFMGDDRTVPLQFGKVVQVFAVVLVPVAAGMLLRAKKAALAKRLDKPVRIASACFLALIALAAIFNERANLPGYVQQIGVACLLFNLLSMSVGYFIPRLARVERKQAIAIGMEIGVHNTSLAMAIASSPLLLNNVKMAVPGAIYSLVMFVTASAFSWFMASRAGAEAPQPPAVAAVSAPPAP